MLPRRSAGRAWLTWPVLVPLLILATVAAAQQGTEQPSAFSIVITSDGEFEDHAAVSSGTGTATDPYIIEGLSLQQTHRGTRTPPMVALVDTTAHVILRSLELVGRDYGTALLLVGTRNVVVEAVTISGAREGILVEGGEGTVLRGNTVTDQRLYGIRLENVTGAGVIDNTAAGAHRGSGIWLDRTDGVLVAGNTASGNGYNGIYMCDVVGASVTGNQVVDNAAMGMDITRSTGVVVAHNRFADNAGNGTELNQDDGTRFSGNVFEDNGGYGIALRSGHGTTSTGDSYISNAAGDTFGPVHRGTEGSPQAAWMVLGTLVIGGTIALLMRGRRRQ